MGKSPYRKVRGEFGEHKPYHIVFGTELHDWEADASESYGGAASGPMPFELLASALGSCTLITLKMYAERKQWDLGNTNVDIQFFPGATKEDKYSAKIELHFDPSLTIEQRESLLKISEKCPVHKVLAPGAQLETVAV